MMFSSTKMMKTKKTSMKEDTKERGDLFVNLMKKEGATVGTSADFSTE